MFVCTERETAFVVDTGCIELHTSLTKGAGFDVSFDLCATPWPGSFVTGPVITWLI